MKCNRCQYPGELEWPLNYTLGNRPLDSKTGKVHECDSILRYTCVCGTKITQFKGERGICSTCQLERFKN